jgi:hypothetical protein
LLDDIDPAYALGPKRNQSGKTSTILKINGYGNWLIGKANAAGTYTGDPTGDAVYFTQVNYLGNMFGAGSVVVTQTDASWTAASGGYFRGNTVASGSDWISAIPSTSVVGGTIKGTFTPATPGVWQSTALYTAIETSEFVAMAATATGRTKLTALNIPSVQVGTATLTGSDGYNTVNINNMNFYASSSGAKPTIWASNSVTGTLTAVTAGSTNLALSGGGLSANFGIKKFDSGKWGAIISGNGGFNGSNRFIGGAAGTYTGTSITTGTASGTAFTGVAPH